jgi:hypothetical protein
LTPGLLLQDYTFSSTAAGSPSTPLQALDPLSPVGLNLTDQGLNPVRPRRRRASFTLEFLHAREWQDESAVAVDSADMFRHFSLVYDGTSGVAAVSHLAEFEKHVRQYPSNVGCPAMRIRIDIAGFAYAMNRTAPSTAGAPLTSLLSSTD